jgi:hypothetical protein
MENEKAHNSSLYADRKRDTVEGARSACTQELSVLEPITGLHDSNVVFH